MSDALSWKQSVVPGSRVRVAPGATTSESKICTGSSAVMVVSAVSVRAFMRRTFWPLALRIMLPVTPLVVKSRLASMTTGRVELLGGSVAATNTKMESRLRISMSVKDSALMPSTLTRNIDAFSPLMRILLTFSDLPCGLRTTADAVAVGSPVNTMPRSMVSVENTGWSAGAVVNPSSMQADVAMSNDSAASMLGRYFIVGMESVIVC